MKIFYPLEVFYPSQAGGPANTIYWITKNLTKLGFDPVIVATDKGIQSGFPLNKWVYTDGCSAIYIKTKFLNFPFYQIFVSLRNFYSADIIHISSFFYPTAFVTAFAAKILNKKIAWSARGELDTRALQHSRLRKLPILWLIKRLIGQTPLFHSTCEEETDYIKLALGNNAKVILIPNYIEIPDKVIRKPQKYLLYIGRIHPKKAIDNLVRAISISQVFLNSDYKLVIAGSGKKEFEVSLHKLVQELNLSDKIIFAGQIEGIEKQQLLADAYFTIMPSHTENFGVVVLESLAQNTPVIASKGSPWESLETEKIGFWIDNSPETIADHIEKIIKLPTDIYNGMREKARDYVIRNFDITENIDKWLEFYGKV